MNHVALHPKRLCTSAVKEVLTVDAEFLVLPRSLHLSSGSLHLKQVHVYEIATPLTVGPILSALLIHLSSSVLFFS